eukprot:gene47157-58855_t
MRVLIVEDEPSLGQQLKNTLEGAGYAIDLATDGEEGHFLGSTENYDAIVLDLGLPEIDGLTVLDRWRKEGRTAPVLVLTARDSWSDKVAGLDAGADDYVAKPFQSEELIARLRALMTASVIAGVFGAIVFVLWLGAHAVIAGSMSAGELASFVLYAVLTAGGVGVIAEVWGDVLRAAGATERLIELLHAESRIQPPANPQPLPQTRQARIEFQNVHFHYPSRPDSASLDGLTLDIREGETVALVGPSGAGKTTIFQLLLRYYDVDSGAGGIRFNGIDLRDLDPAELRAQIGIVPQDAVIFSADASANIRYGNAEATDEQ